MAGSAAIFQIHFLSSKINVYDKHSDNTEVHEETMIGFLFYF